MVKVVFIVPLLAVLENCINVGAAWQRAVSTLPMIPKPRGAESVGDSGRRVLHQERPLQDSGRD